MDKQNVVDFPAARRAAAIRLQRLEEGVREATLSNYPGYEIRTIERAIHIGVAAVRTGHNFTESMEMVDRVFRLEQPEQYNEEVQAARNRARLFQLEQRRAVRMSVYFDAVARFVRADMADQPEEEIAAAIERAKRVIMGGGTMGRALYLATNKGV